MKTKHPSLISPKGRRLLAIALFLLPFGKAGMGYAQTYVAIPDSNFVHYLKTIVPTAFKGDSLNTSSTLVTTTTHAINCSGLSIANLIGVQYFTSLTSLNCSTNSLTTLPALPNSLIILECNYNSLTTLPVLPNSLQILYCPYNSLTTLPALPNLLIQLWCNNNNLTTLPIIPNSLRLLVCKDNNITCFPTFLNSIDTLAIDPNPFNCLPNYIGAMNATDLAKPLCAAGNSNGCAVAGIEQYNINNEVTVYPNPAKESLTLTLSKGEGTSTLQITDMLGKQVLSKSLTPALSKGEGVVIDVSSLSEGVYNLSVSTNEGVANKRVVIAK